MKNRRLQKRNKEDEKKKKIMIMMYLQMYSNCWEKMFQNNVKLINSVYESERPKHFIQFKMIALKNMAKPTKYSDHRTISFFADTAKTVAMILRKRIESNIKSVL